MAPTKKHSGVGGAEGTSTTCRCTLSPLRIQTDCGAMRGPFGLGLWPFISVNNAAAMAVIAKCHHIVKAAEVFSLQVFHYRDTKCSCLKGVASHWAKSSSWSW